jgi:hypothetical protein
MPQIIAWTVRARKLRSGGVGRYRTVSPRFTVEAAAQRFLTIYRKEHADEEAIIEAVWRTDSIEEAQR